MKHIHEKTGQEYEVGRLDDFGGATYDMCVITKWPDFESDKVEGPIIIDYYFGEYDKETTDYYIDKYFEKLEHLKKGLEFLKGDYLINVIDGDYMTKEEGDQLKNSISTLESMITKFVK